jgi:hypothetical protein
MRHVWRVLGYIGLAVFVLDFLFAFGLTVVVIFR